MKVVNRQSVTPLNVPRTRRMHPLRVLTTLPVGKYVPIAAIPLLREDNFVGRFSIASEMLETDEILMNRVNLRITPWLVPWLAFKRFEGSRDQFDRSYMGQPKTLDEGAEVVPFIETHEFGAAGANEIYKYLGLHGKATDQVNTMYNEAYNLIWNFEARNVSRKLTQRDRLDDELAPAFWRHSQFGNMVPDFEDAMMEGEIPLEIIDPELSLKGKTSSLGYDETRGVVRQFRADDPATTYVSGVQQANGTTALTAPITNATGAAQAWRQYLDLSAVMAELDANGITISLANLEMVKKVQYLAKMRERFDGFDDEYVIDMLMGGMTIPDQHMKQPIKLGQTVTVPYQQSKRYATDAGNLAESATSGGTGPFEMRVRCPVVNTGGVIMLIAEVVPEQLFERQRDPFLYLPGTGHLDALPEFKRDFLDTQKVDEVKNAEIDVSHSTPNGTFAYTFMNAKWTQPRTNVGGDFLRPTVDAEEDERRKRIYAVEVADPVWSEDFLIVTEIHQKPFLIQDADVFELMLSGSGVIEGNTQFGRPLIEATGNFDAIKADVPTDKLDPTP